MHAELSLRLLAAAEVEPRCRAAGLSACTAECEFAAGPLAQRVAMLLGVVLIPACLVDNASDRTVVAQQGIGTRGDVSQPGSRGPPRRDLQTPAEMA